MSKEPKTKRPFKILNIIILIFSAIQASLGGFLTGIVNITTSPISFSISSFINQVKLIGAPLILHVWIGIFLLICTVLLFAFSFIFSKSKAVKITSGLGLLSLIIAILGGLQFVLSGFTSGAGDSMMGNGFILSYALFFLALYFSKD